MFRMGESFKEYDITDYGYTEDPDDNEEIFVIGAGYIYSFAPADGSEKSLPPPQYTAAADEHPADAAYPFVRMGGWGGVSILETDQHDSMGAYAFSADMVFAEHFALGVEIGSMPFRWEEDNYGHRETMTVDRFTAALVAEFIVKASDVIETSVVLGAYYGGDPDYGGRKDGVGLLYCGANLGFVLGRHHIIGTFRYAQDNFSSGAGRMTSVGGGYKYDLY
jgi:hypothetical protein